MQTAERYTVDEAAELAGINPVTIRRYIRRGIITPQRKGRRYLLTKSDLQKIPKKGVSTSLMIPPEQIPNLEPMQDLLTQINKTFVQLSEQNAATTQNLAQEYGRSVKPIVQKVTGEVAPEITYENLRAELMAYIQKPMHRMVQNAMLMKKAVVENPELENLPLSDAIDWFLKSLLHGLEEDGFPLTETAKQLFRESIIHAEHEKGTTVSNP